MIAELPVLLEDCASVAMNVLSNCDAKTKEQRMSGLLQRSLAALLPVHCCTALTIAATNARRVIALHVSMSAEGKRRTLESNRMQRRVWPLEELQE